ncbi:MAG: polysaccharide biosynthesis tyrosine autokinase [Bacteroidales bacterium]|nr:polysaccharide biosynthesis tyrosine autokinase [Bacteroidales bacterium]
MADYIENQANQEEEQSLKLADIWEMIWGNKWWYVISVLLCLLAAAFYLYRTPNTYSRTEKIILDEASQQMAMRDLTKFTRSTGYRTGGDEVYNEMEAFTSPDLMQQVVERLGLEASYMEIQPLRKRELYKTTPFELVLAGDNTASGFDFKAHNTKNGFELTNFVVNGLKLDDVTLEGSYKDTLDSPVGRIVLVPTEYLGNFNRDIIVSWRNSGARAKAYCSRLSASLSNKMSSVIVLTQKDGFASRATNILRTLLDIYNENWILNKNKSATNTSKFIDERLAVIEEELGGIESNIKEFRQTNRLPDAPAVTTTYLGESSQYAARSFEINNQLSVAKYIREYLSDPAHNRALIPSNVGIQNANVESQIAEYNELLLKRDRLLTNTTESNPIIVDLNASLDQLKSNVIRSVDNLISTLQLQANKAASQEQQVLNRISATSGQALDLMSKERQQKVKEELYIFLLQKREENQLQTLVNVENTRLIMAPNGSSAPIAPGKMKVLLVALLLGLAIPFAIFYIRRLLDTTIKNRNDVQRLSVPFLAEIPQLGLKGNYFKRARTNRYDNKYCDILVESGKRDTVNEAFRVLRTNLDLMAGHGEGCKLIMVTSFNPNAGKTFNILNMAASMALKGAKTLIMDLDLRKATLSKALDKNNRGVAAYLNSKTDSISEYIQPIRENLSLLSVGTLPPNPAEMLVSERFNSMIDELRGQFDYLFVDCPPVDVVADTAIVSRVADITVFVIRARLFDKRSLPMIENLYKEGKYNRMALILNGVETTGGKHGYGYGYGYGEGSEKSKEEKKSKKA